MTAYHLSLFAHVGLGVAALATFWIAALAKKGSAPHKLAGKIYVFAMVGLLLPALPLSWRALQHFSFTFGVFLFYLILITATAVWRGWFAVRRKRDFAAYAGPGLRRMGYANIAGGAAVLGMGAALLQPVFLGFSLVGILGGQGMVKLAGSGAPEHARWWLEQHLSAMLGCGVATHIAFLLLGLPRALPASWNGPALQTIGWLGPLLVAGLARAWLGRKYLPKAAAQSPRTISPVSTLRREAADAVSLAARIPSK